MKYYAYTDGSSRGNPGPSGWATIVMNDDKVREYNGYFEKATNNQMEMYGVLYALNFALSNLNKKDTDEDSIEIGSDSQYVVKGCNEWVYGWVKNKWINSQKKEVMNKDMWQDIWKAINDMKFKKIDFKIVHVKGHNGHIHNERADKLCTAASTKEKIDFYNGDRQGYDDFIKN